MSCRTKLTWYQSHSHHPLAVCTWATDVTSLSPGSFTCGGRMAMMHLSPQVCCDDEVRCHLWKHRLWGLQGVTGFLHHSCSDSQKNNKNDLCCFEWGVDSTFRLVWTWLPKAPGLAASTLEAVRNAESWPPSQTYWVIVCILTRSQRVDTNTLWEMLVERGPWSQAGGQHHILACGEEWVESRP